MPVQVNRMGDIDNVGVSVAGCGGEVALDKEVYPFVVVVVEHDGCVRGGEVFLDPSAVLADEAETRDFPVKVKAGVGEDPMLDAGIYVGDVGVTLEADFECFVLAEWV